MPSPYTGVLGTASPGGLMPDGPLAVRDAILSLPGLVRFWPLDDPAGTAVYHDETGAGHLTLSAPSGAGQGNSQATVVGSPTVASGARGPGGAPCALLPYPAWSSSYTGFTPQAFLTDSVLLADNYFAKGSLYFWYSPAQYPAVGNDFSEGMFQIYHNYGASSVVWNSSRQDYDYVPPWDTSRYINSQGFQAGGYGLNDPASPNYSSLFASGNTPSGAGVGFAPMAPGQWYEFCLNWDLTDFSRYPAYNDGFMGWQELYVNRQRVYYAPCWPNLGANQDHPGQVVTILQPPKWVTIGSMGGYYANAAVLNRPIPAGFFSARTPAAADLGPVSTANLRLTNAFMETLSGRVSNARVSQAPAEVVRTGNYRGRVSHVAVEVLRSAANSVPIDVSASTSFDLGVSTGTLVGVTRSVQAATAMSVGAGSYRAMTYAMTTATGFGVATGTYRHIAQTFDAFAASGVGLDAGGTIVRVNNNVYVYVHTGLGVRPRAADTVYVTRTYDVSAATGLNVVSVPPRAARLYNASAATAFGVTAEAGYYNTRKPVSAATAFQARARAGEPLVTHTLLASAATGLVCGSAGSFTATFSRPVRAATALRLGHAATETRDAAATATTSVRAGAVAFQAGRDIFVSAATGLGVASAEHSNQSPHMTRASAFVLYVQASSVITGTTADTGVEFVHLAQAEVSLPWRRSSLTLPPGGQIPH